MKLSTAVRQVFTRTIAYGNDYAVVACLAELNTSTGEWTPVSEPRIVRIIRATATRLSAPSSARASYILAAPQAQLSATNNVTHNQSWYSELFAGNTQSILSWFGARPPTLA